jgi:hypothetical protein
MNTKTLVAASAALALLAAARVAHATTVATLPVTLTGSGAGFITITGSGSGVLDSSGTFTVDSNLTLVDTGVQETATIAVQETFTGVLSPGSFRVTAGTTDLLSCAGGAVICSEAPGAVITSASGSISPSGGTLMTTVFDPASGITLNDTYAVGAGTFSSPAPAVPLPPAVWLLGSGLLGLAGGARRRLAGSQRWPELSR